MVFKRRTESRNIPKGNGKMRGLGSPSFEDKVVQGVFREILEGIYEQKFLDFPMDFAPTEAVMTRSRK